MRTFKYVLTRPSQLASRSAREQNDAFVFERDLAIRRLRDRRVVTRCNSDVSGNYRLRSYIVLNANWDL